MPLPFIFKILILIVLPAIATANTSTQNINDKEKDTSSFISFLTPKELKWLEKRQPLNYVYDPDWAPFEWTNDIGLHTGIIPEILHIIENKTGIIFNPVHTKTWKESVELAKKARVDMFSAITINSERKEYLHFTSKDIFSYPAVLLTRFNDKTIYLDLNKDAKEKKIGIVKGSGLGAFIKKNNPSLHFIEIPSTQAGFDLLSDKNIDLFAINTVTARYYIEKKNYDDLKIALKLDYIYHLKIAIIKSLPVEVISILDKALQSISDEELNIIFKKWTDSATIKKTDWSYIAQILSVVFFVLLFLLWNTHRLNKLVKDKTKELLIEKNNAEEANKAKSLFLAKMSHELRTPLNGVIGLTQLLSIQDLKEEQKEIVSKLMISCDLLHKLINDVLDLSKIEAGKLSLEHSRFDVRELFQECLEIFHNQISEKGLKLRSNIDDNIPKEIVGDSQRIAQILLNLMSNAVKYTNMGSIQVNAELIENNYKQSILQLTVIDTGIGMSEETQATMFSSFSQGDNSISRQYGGSGLGLSICKQLIKLMGGSINFSSREGGGSIFVCRIPVGLVIKEETDKAKEKPSVLQEEVHILVVDDDEINLFLAKNILESEGFQVSLAKSGEQAIKKAEQHKFNLVLMDIHMPDLNGYDTTRLFRASMLPQLAYVPIIGFTADVLNENREKCLACGMNSIASKPFKVDELINEVNSILTPIV